MDRYYRRSAEEDGLRRLSPGDVDMGAVLLLIQGAFAYMDGRVDPPSSMHRMTLDKLDEHAAEGEVWVIGKPVVACFVLSRRPDSLYLAKLAVAPSARGRGLARRLIELADIRARDLGLPCIELQTRVELVDNHATFAALGFRMVGETAHPGFDRPTSLTFRRPVTRADTPALP